MPNIEIIRFNHFTARKSERYTATHNGLYVVEEGALLVHQPNGEQFELKAGDFTLYNSADLSSAEAIPSEDGFKALALVFNPNLFCDFKKHTQCYAPRRKKGASILFQRKPAAK